MSVVWGKGPGETPPDIEAAQQDPSIREISVLALQASDPALEDEGEEASGNGLQETQFNGASLPEMGSMEGLDPDSDPEIVASEGIATGSSSVLSPAILHSDTTIGETDDDEEDATADVSTTASVAPSFPPSMAALDAVYEEARRGSQKKSSGTPVKNVMTAIDGVRRGGAVSDSGVKDCLDSCIRSAGVNTRTGIEARLQCAEWFRIPSSRVQDYRTIGARQDGYGQRARERLTSFTSNSLPGLGVRFRPAAISVSTGAVPQLVPLTPQVIHNNINNFHAPVHNVQANNEHAVVNDVPQEQVKRNRLVRCMCEYFKLTVTGIASIIIATILLSVLLSKYK